MVPLIYFLTSVRIQGQHDTFPLIPSIVIGTTAPHSLISQIKQVLKGARFNGLEAPYFGNQLSPPSVYSLLNFKIKQFKIYNFLANKGYHGTKYFFYLLHWTHLVWFRNHKGCGLPPVYLSALTLVSVKMAHLWLEFLKSHASCWLNLFITNKDVRQRFLKKNPCRRVLVSVKVLPDISAAGQTLYVSFLLKPTVNSCL